MQRGPPRHPPPQKGAAVSLPICRCASLRFSVPDLRLFQTFQWDARVRHELGFVAPIILDAIFLLWASFVADQQKEATKYFSISTSPWGAYLRFITRRVRPPVSPPSGDVECAHLIQRRSPNVGHRVKQTQDRVASPKLQLTFLQPEGFEVVK